MQCNNIMDHKFHITLNFNQKRTKKLIKMKIKNKKRKKITKNIKNKINLNK